MPGETKNPGAICNRQTWQTPWKPLPTNMNPKQRMAGSMRQPDKNTSHEKLALKQHHGSISSHVPEQDCQERGYTRCFLPDHHTKFSIRHVFESNTLVPASFDKMENGSSNLHDETAVHRRPDMLVNHRPNYSAIVVWLMRTWGRISRANSPALARPKKPWRSSRRGHSPRHRLSSNLPALLHPTRAKARSAWSKRRTFVLLERPESTRRFSYLRTADSFNLFCFSLSLFQCLNSVCFAQETKKLQQLNYLRRLPCRGLASAAIARWTAWYGSIVERRTRLSLAFSWSPTRFFFKLILIFIILHQYITYFLIYFSIFSHIRVASRRVPPAPGNRTERKEAGLLGPTKAGWGQTWPSLALSWAGHEPPWAQLGPNLRWTRAS